MLSMDGIRAGVDDLVSAAILAADWEEALAHFALAAGALRTRAVGGEQTTLANELVNAVGAMPQRPIAEQRKLFAAVSDAAIEFATRSPRTGERVPRLLVAHCPMVEACWLQDAETISNPYYATTMKLCGEIERELAIPSSDEAPATHEHDHSGGRR